MGLSAKRIGEKIGLTAEQTNVLLKEEGYQDGCAGNYIITEKGKRYVEEKHWDNGYGGWAAKGYSYNEWDENIIDDLDTTPENLNRIRDITYQRRNERKNKKGQETNIEIDVKQDERDNSSTDGFIILIITVIIAWITKKICGLFKRGKD